MEGGETKHERSRDVSGVFLAQEKVSRRGEIEVALSWLDRTNEYREAWVGEGVNGCEVAWRKCLGIRQWREGVEGDHLARHLVVVPYSCPRLYLHLLPLLTMV